MTIFFLCVLVAVLFCESSAFILQSARQTRGCIKPVNAFNLDSFLLSKQEVLQKVAEIADKGDDYKYGAVEAPVWALPLGAFLALSITIVPFLLKGGQDVRIYVWI
jgi:hypothetical protein